MPPEDHPITRGPGRPPLVEGETTVSCGVRLSPKDWALVRKVAKLKHSRSASAGIREMVRFYRLYHPEHQIKEA